MEVCSGIQTVYFQCVLVEGKILREWKESVWYGCCGGEIVQCVGEVEKRMGRREFEIRVVVWESRRMSSVIVKNV
ncbi:hypothetical protein COLO4_09305 [Corchorus olitorius]|uniref:Uncharacterized protein n=1 Tax=Corchorus olitorius TaxID=93759 RepID=A0A1R3KCK9_9ROSI|nr:hypothetical protein COLO4_09305 [Corchorus olitorius]